LDVIVQCQCEVPRCGILRNVSLSCNEGTGVYRTICILLSQTFTGVEGSGTSIETVRTQKRHNFEISIGA
jgi:hypothetical protein